MVVPDAAQPRSRVHDKIICMKRNFAILSLSCEILREDGSGTPTVTEISSHQPLGRRLKLDLMREIRKIISCTRMLVQ